MPRPMTITIDQQNCDLLHEAFRLYREELEALTKVREPSEAIKMELELVKFLLPKFFETPRNNGGHATLTLDDDVWAFIKDIGEKYLEAQRQRVHIAKATEHIEGSTTEEEQRLEHFRQLLEGIGTNNLPEKKALIKDFFRQTSGGTANETERNTLIQVQVGNIYGGNVAIAGVNNGEVNQGALPSDLGEFLTLFTQQIMNMAGLSEEQRNNAIGDVQTIQAQQTKVEPDKGIIRRAVESLSVLADVSAVGQTAAMLTPYIEHLAHIASKL